MATNAQRAAVLDHQYGGPNLTRPATIYLGLSTTEPTATGSNFTEPVGGSYARLEITNDTDAWNAATAADPAVKTNKDTFEMVKATAQWGTVTHWGFFTASTGGTPFETGVIVDSNGDPDPKLVDVGVTVKFEPGTIRIIYKNP